MTALPASYNRAYALAHRVPADDWLFDELLALLAPQPGWRVLDVGCNTGELTARLAQRGCRATGIDLNPDAIALAREQFPDLDFRVATLEQMAPAAWEAIIASHVIEHLPDAPGFVRAARRALKPDGLLVLATPNRHAWMRRLFRAPFFEDPTHVRFYTARELRDLLVAGGFGCVVATTRRLYFPLAGRLPQRLRLAIPAGGWGDHLLVRAR